MFNLRDTKSKQAQQLRQQLDRLASITRLRHHPHHGLDPKHAQLSRWQASRLRQTHRDLLHNPRYGEAVEFFCEELYGPKDFSQRDYTFEKIYPSMVRWLPGDALATVSMAMELNALSCELDQQLVQALLAKGDDDGLQITPERYAEAFRRCDNFAERRHQVMLVARLGRDLDRLVRLPFIQTTLKLARKPAQFMGFGEMQRMLEEGFSAFRQMNGASEFIDTVVKRELLIIQRIFEAHPEPFEIAPPAR